MYQEYDIYDIEALEFLIKYKNAMTPLSKQRYNTKKKLKQTKLLS